MDTNIANKRLHPGGNTTVNMAELDALYNRLEATGESTSDCTGIAKLLNSVLEDHGSILDALMKKVNVERS